MKTKLALFMVLFAATTAHAGSAGFEEIFGEFPIVDEPEVRAPGEFEDVWTDADYAQEPILLMTRAAAAPEELPVDNDGGFCRGVARIEDAQRAVEVKRYTREVLRDAQVSDPGRRIEGCMVRYATTLTHDMRLNCLALLPSQASASVLIGSFRQELTQAMELCVGISPITDRQIKSALAELLRSK